MIEINLVEAALIDSLIVWFSWLIMLSVWWCGTGYRGRQPSSSCVKTRRLWDIHVNVPTTSAPADASVPVQFQSLDWLKFARFSSCTSRLKTQSCHVLAGAGTWTNGLPTLDPLYWCLEFRRIIVGLYWWDKYMTFVTPCLSDSTHLSVAAWLYSVHHDGRITPVLLRPLVSGWYYLPTLGS